MQITDEMIDAAAKAFWSDGITYKTERRQSVRAMLEAALAAAWRPIETAPKDGTEIILTNGLWVAVGWYSHSPFLWRDAQAGAWVDSDPRDGGGALSGVNAPTHWMPLPQPPSHKECATEDCARQATVRFERGGIGSDYCHDCYMRIQHLTAPERDEALDKLQDASMAGAAVHAVREMLNEIGVPQAAFIDDHVRNGLVWARRKALEEALLAAETVKNIPPESWEVSLVVKAIRELIDAKEQGGET